MDTSLCLFGVAECQNLLARYISIGHISRSTMTYNNYFQVEQSRCRKKQFNFIILTYCSYCLSYDFLLSFHGNTLINLGLITCMQLFSYWNCLIKYNFQTSKGSLSLLMKIFFLSQCIPGLIIRNKRFTVSPMAIFVLCKQA